MDRSVVPPSSSPAHSQESVRPEESRSASEVTAATEKANSANPLKTIYGPIAKSLAAVDARLHRELQSRYEALMPVLRHGTQLGGKRLRPALLLLSGKAMQADQAARSNVQANGDDGESSDDHVVMATVVEMVHTATLVHDDVLDKASTRRHVPTINARWNDDTSILLGDYLFAQSFYLAATLPSTLACRLVGEAAQKVCEGELRQVLGRDWLDIDEETYLDIIRGKTAELTRVACQLGAELSGGSEEDVAAFATFGNDLGIAFQIADDFLDLWGDDDNVGKTLGTDLQQGKITLPLIRLLRHEDTSVATAALDALRLPPEDRLGRVMPLLRKSDAADYTRQVAEKYRRSAIEAIGRFKPSLALESLKTIADFAVDRRF
ncbi:polyprenyl synthetase family protein [Rhodopirellula halodulae]|uniref:polyprenyl synthetase family protein n=1 Tax=Rhodopirellula halodulae TaxID=2894198 RepID=UPI001E4F8D0B|nr:polyprenyl synthetase family protein [Rhodopirellula sp. JC737]MCC9657591.1 polyprenyl synthetase family protein [Rhodopirellula sp. JC737]